MLAVVCGVAGETALDGPIGELVDALEASVFLSSVTIGEVTGANGFGDTAIRDASDEPDSGEKLVCCGIACNRSMTTVFTVLASVLDDQLGLLFGVVLSSD